MAVAGRLTLGRLRPAPFGCCGPPTGNVPGPGKLTLKPPPPGFSCPLTMVTLAEPPLPLLPLLEPAAPVRAPEDSAMPPSSSHSWVTPAAGCVILHGSHLAALPEAE